MKAVQGMNQTQQVYQSNKIKEQLVEDWKNERLQKKKSQHVYDGVLGV
jgi:hypothetical protein